MIKIEEFINREVIYNQTVLVNDLLNTMSLGGNGLASAFSYDNIENAYPELSEYEDYGYESEEEFEMDMMPKEIFEWWLVTEYFGNKLREKGIPVLENDYGFWWGRTTTGQAISLDGEIKEIYKDIKLTYNLINYL